MVAFQMGECKKALSRVLTGAARACRSSREAPVRKNSPLDEGHVLYLMDWSIFIIGDLSEVPGSIIMSEG